MSCSVLGTDKDHALLCSNVDDEDNRFIREYEGELSSSDTNIICCDHDVDIEDLSIQQEKSSLDTKSDALSSITTYLTVDDNDEYENRDIAMIDAEKLIPSNSTTNIIRRDPNDDDDDDDDGDLYERPILAKLHFYFTTASAVFIIACLIAHELRPHHVKMARRSIPLSHRRLNYYYSSFSNDNSNKQWKRWIRQLQDEDEEGESNDNNSEDENSQDEDNQDENEDEENENDENYEDDYYNYDEVDYYNNDEGDDYVEKDEEPTYIEDDFFRFVDDDDVFERRLLPLETSDILGLLCISMSLILAAAGGIGGGAILVAILMIVMDFPAKVAIPLSCIAGLSVATASTGVNIRKRHPLADRPIIDWDLIMIMEPLTLLGALIGTLLNKILPEKFLVSMLVLLLTAIANSTLKKAQKLHHHEEIYLKRVEWANRKRHKRQKTRYQITATTDPSPPPTNQNKLSSNTYDVLSNNDDTPKASNNTGNTPNKNKPPPGKKRSKQKRSNSPDELQTFIKVHNVDTVRSSIMVEEADPLPQNKITYVTAMFIFVIAVVVIKGGGAFESPLGIQCGSASFWIVNFLTFIWLLGCTYLAGGYLLRKHAIKEAVGFDYVKGDIKWNLRTIVVYPSLCMIAGLVSGMFGIGSAIVTAPLMITINVHTMVSAATSSCMNWFTSLAATSSYVVLGSVIPDYAILCSIIGFCATRFGRFLMTKSLSKRKNRKLERHSYIAYSMGTVVLVSALLMTIEALLSIITNKPFLHQDDTVGICEAEY